MESARFSAFVAFTSIFIIQNVLASEDKLEGFLLDNGETTTELDSAGGRQKELKCPSSNVIETRYRCKAADGHWTDCARRSCCPGHTLVVGRCIPDGANPCSLGLCEQR